MFSHYDSAHIATASLNAGALGYVVKSDAGRACQGLLGYKSGQAVREFLE
jgi:hypothetical protein